LFLWFYAYYSSGCTGKQRENLQQNGNISVCVNLGGSKFLVESQYVSNHDFLEVIVWLEFVTYHFFFTLCFYASLLDSLISVDLVGLMYFNSTSWHLYGYLRFSSIVDAYMYMFKLRARMAKSNNSFFFALFITCKVTLFPIHGVSNVAGSNFVKQWC